MSAPPAADVTDLLLAWRKGDHDALERLLPLVYNELHLIAHARMRAESPGAHTLQTTALVNEAFVRLVDGARVEWTDRVHFYAVCARLMRQDPDRPCPRPPLAQARRRDSGLPDGELGRRRAGPV